ncbi:MAG TPA: serine hydrolase [Xanthobacteraceae bacterium]
MRVQTKLLIAILLGALAGPGDGHAQAANDLGQTVSRHVQELLPDNNLGGVAVALRVNGKTSLYNYGMADAARQQPITSDSIFNLASVGKLFATTLLADAVKRGEMRLDDPVAKYVTELQKGGDIQEVTLGQIASHTSGLPREPGQYETWHRGKYTLPDFIRFLNDWQADPQHEPGKQDIYSNLAMILLRLALERRFHEPFATLMKERITGPLGMDSTALQLSPALRARAVQGYGPLGRVIGQPGIGTSSNMDFAVAGQIFSSPRDMAVFLTANMGELPGHRELQDAMAFAQQGVFTVNPRFTQGLAWQIVQRDDLTVIDKNGGLPVTSTYIGFAPAAKVGIVILENRGRQKTTRVGRQILRELARAMTLDPPDDGADPD